jgi:hypothetical protein
MKKCSFGCNAGCGWFAPTPGLFWPLIEERAYPERRKLLSIVAADAQGRINGMTVPELLTIVNLTAGTNEKTYLTTSGKEVIFWAETRPSVNVSTL